MIGDTFDRFQPKDRGLFGDNEQQEQRGRLSGPRVNGASNMVDLVLRFEYDKLLAIAVTDPLKPRQKWIWLQKRKIEFEQDGRGLVTVTLPDWLAKEKGLI
jgi:hypothetical protein